MASRAEDLGTDLLPPRLAELAEMCGVDVAHALVERFPGMRLYVPEEVGEDHPLAAALGIEAARRLAREYGREHIEIPRAAGAAREARNRAIRAESRNATQGELARRYGLTERQIRTILRSSGDDGTQQPLI